MLNEKRKEKIKNYMNAWKYLVDRRVPTDADWDKYFIDNYKGRIVMCVEGCNGGFLTYEYLKDRVLIKDFVAHGDGLQIANQFFKTIGQTPVRCTVHSTNFDFLNVLVGRFKFRICGFNGVQYTLERR